MAHEGQRPMSLEESKGPHRLLQPPFPGQAPCHYDRLSPNACPGGGEEGLPPVLAQPLAGEASVGSLGAAGSGRAPRQQKSAPRWVRGRAGRSPPGAPGAAPRAQLPPSPTAPPAAPSSRDPRGSSVASEDRPLLADRRGMTSGGSRHVTRRRSSSSPSRASNLQPPPWEQRRARVGTAGGAGGCGRGPAGRRRAVLGLFGIQVGAGGGARQGRGARPQAKALPPRVSQCSLGGSGKERALGQLETRGSPGLGTSPEGSLL